MTGIFVENVTRPLADGWQVTVRPLTYRQREEARRVKVNEALELAKNLDPEVMERFERQSSAAAEKAPSVELTGDLDPVTVVKHGVVGFKSPDGQFLEADEETIERLDARTFEHIAGMIYGLSEVPAGDVGPLLNA